MKVLLTGANGFVGRALVTRLLDSGRLGTATDGAAAAAAPLTTLTLVDLRFDDPRVAADPRVRLVTGSIADPAVREQALRDEVDVVFHLASVTSRQAQEEAELGRRVNLHGTFALFEMLAAQQRVPTVVFSSSIAVFGAPMPSHIDDATPLLPVLSYGAQKQIGEILLADYTRHGRLDGRAVRLPGIVVRPPVAGGAFSSFNSDLIRCLAAGEPYVCPVSARATLWMMSLPRCIDNLLNAATSASAGWPGTRAVTLPALVLSIEQLVAALAARCGPQVHQQLSYRPDATLEAQFGNFPPLSTSRAEQLGFRHDGDVAAMLSAVLEAA